MRDSDFRADRALAALMQRQVELKRQLDMKNTQAAYEMNHGFVFHFQGRERVRMEQEVEFIASLLQILAEPDGPAPMPR